MKWVKPQSLYLQLLLFLGLPLILLWGLSAFNSYVNALQAATQAYDRTLLSSARTVSERLVVRNITFIVIYRMTTIVSDPTITQTESRWQTVRTVRRRQGSGGEP